MKQVAGSLICALGAPVGGGYDGYEGYGWSWDDDYGYDYGDDDGDDDWFDNFFGFDDVSFTSTSTFSATTSICQHEWRLTSCQHQHPHFSVFPAVTL
jgi:hypothetical protein